MAGLPDDFLPDLAAGGGAAGGALGIVFVTAAPGLAATLAVGGLTAGPGFGAGGLAVIPGGLGSGLFASGFGATGLTADGLTVTAGGLTGTAGGLAATGTGFFAGDFLGGGCFATDAQSPFAR